MRSITRRLVAGVATLTVVLAAAACGPQAQPPSQPAPSGGRILLNGPQGYRLEIADATDDFSRIVVEQYKPDASQLGVINARYSIYDDTTKVTTLLPVTGLVSAVRLMPDDHRVVFSSNDPDLQTGPVPQNCIQYNGFFQPLTHTYCAELYLYDLTDGSLRQLTGVGGASPTHNFVDDVAPDGSTIDYTGSNPIPEGGGGPGYHRRMDLATGVSVDVPVPTCCSSVRGNHRITWTPYGPIPTLTSEDLDTSVVTTLSRPDDIALASHTDDGHFVVLVRENQKLHVIDTDTGADADVPGSWISDDGSRYLRIQLNPFPNNSDQVVVGPVKW